MVREREVRDGGEKLQIAILTLGMTGGGFALLTVILVFFLNPAAADRVQGLTTRSGLLMKELKDDELRQLRVQAKLNEGQENTQSLREIVFDASRRRYLELGTIPNAKIEEKGGLQKIEQTVNLKPGKLRQIFQFLGDMKDAKRTIQIESVTITKDRRARADDEDAWSCTMRLVDYVQKSSS